MERNRRKMLASVGWDLTGFRHWRSQCHEIDRRSMSVAAIESCCNGWIDFQCVVLRVCGIIRNGVWLSLARAPGLGPGGRRFESCHPDLIMREWLSWWSTTLPRLGSRVRVPSRALLKVREILEFSRVFLFFALVHNEDNLKTAFYNACATILYVSSSVRGL